MPQTDRASRHTPNRRIRPSVMVVLTVVAALTSLGVPVEASASTAPTTPSASAPARPQLATRSVSAYWVAASDGGVFAFGGAPFYGSMGGTHLNRPVVGIAATSPTDSDGYREVASDGGIFSFGDAGFYGSTGNIQLNQPIVGMAATNDGKGYWLVASDGGIFAFGDAGFYGSMGGKPLNQPVVGMATTADNKGYWLVAADGGIFAFGDAAFYGSAGNLRLEKPVVAMTTTGDHHGYWMVASDGGVFAYGDAGFYGSLGGMPQAYPIVSMTATANGRGYWFTNSNGAVTAFGDATYWGSTPQVLAAPVVGMTQATGNGTFTGSSYPSGSYGYDISDYQCGNYPPAPHTIGIVQVEGASFGTTNPCLAGEAAWAGAGLNLYVFLTYGLAASSADPACGSSDACNFGYDAGIDAFQKAQAAGVDTSVAWWLDVETVYAPLPAWSSDQSANSQVIQGAIDALHAEGLNSVGIYASPGVWPGIVGYGYQPSVPYWAADYGPPPAQTCTDINDLWSGLPSGPVEIVQYDSNTYDDDYAC